MSAKEPRTFHVVSHTHWDREWYQSFEVFRLRLVDLMDRLLAIYDGYPDFTFHLDAQTVCLEDYLEIRPQERERLEGLIASGRIVIGPWYVQNDFYLSSGESTLRNLLVGSEIARGFGACDAVGYTPDQFGLISQLPQIYRQFGFEFTVFGRGYKAYEKDAAEEYVPTKRASEFDWASPDGSAVHAVCMSEWYNNAQRFSADPDRALHQLEQIDRTLGSAPTTHHRLLMNGVDHLEAQENLLPILGQLQARLKDGESIFQSTLRDYAKATQEILKDQKKERVEGELRFGRDLDVLQGTLSSRRYLKILNARCQTLLELELEPLYTSLARLTGGRIDYPFDALRYLWKEIMKNQAHDSICGCSTDRVHQDDENRFLRVLDCGGDLRRRGLQELMKRLDRQGLDGSEFLLAVVNPLPFTRSETVTATLRFPLADRVRGFDLVDPDGRKVDYETVGTIRHYRMNVSPLNLPGLLAVEEVSVRFAASNVPASGYMVYRVVPTDATMQDASPPETTPVIENGLLSVAVSETGRVSLHDLESGWKTEDLFSFEDAADLGDAYCFVPEDGGRPFDLSKSKPTVEVVEKNALRQCIRLEYRFELPSGFDKPANRRSSERVENRVSVELSLQAGSPLLDISGWVENASKDHRLRIVVHAGIDTDHNTSSQPFDCVERGRYPKQPDLKLDWTHPNDAWVSVDDGRHQVGVLTDSMYDYEHLSDDRHSLAFSCVRATGRILAEVFDLTAKEAPPAPEWAAPENQCLRTLPFHLAVRPGSVSSAGLTREWQCWRTPLLTGFDSVDPHRFMAGRPALQDSELSEMFYRDPPPSETNLPFRAQGVSVGGDVAFSACKQREDRDGYVLRMYNPSNNGVSVKLSGVAAVRETTLAEIPVGEFEAVEEELERKVAPRRIATFEIE